MNVYVKDLEKKRFTLINEGFVCANCGEDVLPTKHDHPRNHCPFCLYSIHVDKNPGDRLCKCKGLMKPIGVTVGGKHEYTIIHECKKCKTRIPAPAIIKSDIQNDDMTIIISLSINPIVEYNV